MHQVLHLEPRGPALDLLPNMFDLVSRARGHHLRVTAAWRTSIITHRLCFHAVFFFNAELEFVLKMMVQDTADQWFTSAPALWMFWTGQTSCYVNMWQAVSCRWHGKINFSQDEINKQDFGSLRLCASPWYIRYWWITTLHIYRCKFHTLTYI